MVSKHMIDTVTVVFRDELEVLRLQAQSLNLYGRDLANIFVIVNEESNLDQKIDKSWWGRWSEKVLILPRNNFGNTWCDNGWVSQQALKLLGAANCQSPWSIILDAKTIFVKPMPELAQRPQVGSLPVYPVFEPSRQIVNALFDIDLQQQLGPGGVPFIMNTKQVCDLIAWIECKTEQSFAGWFQQQGRLTEFILYSAWILYRTGSLDSIYNTSYKVIVPANLCHSQVFRFEQRFIDMIKATTVSIHRNAWSQLTQDQQQRYMNFLHSRGIT